MEFLANEGGDEFIDWIQRNGFEVVVFDMDRTMSTSHCGSGLKKEDMHEFISNASKDFITAIGRLKSLDFRCAVATGSDPAEYDLPGQSRESHILGPGLATALINHHCPSALETFGIMVGYDDRMHSDNTESSEKTENKAVNKFGKRHHMRLIQQYYQVPYHKMVLFDDYQGSLDNEDGWIAYGYCDDTMSLPTIDLDATAQLYKDMFGVVEVSRVPGKSLVLQRDGVQLGFEVNGRDPCDTGAALLVADIYRALSEIQYKQLEITNWRVDERDGQMLQVFFVRLPDRLCFCFHAPLARS